MSQNVNHVVISGRLTRDPELRSTPSGTAVCKLGVAVNDRVKVNEEWQDRPNFFDVDVFAGRAETCAKYLERGQAVTIQGRLRWRSWENDKGEKRQAVSIVADLVEFGAKAGQSAGKPADAFGKAKQFVAEGAQASDAADDDDIPF